MEIYRVGGAVRDKLLGLPVRENDWVVVGATPQQMLDQGYQQVGKNFPVFLHPETKEEHALARTERKTGHGYKGFAFHASPDVTLEQDLQRRDLTINAMAEAPDGTLIDPYHGKDDLDQGLLRHVSPAFAEDPVRILRVARFAARFGQWGFKVAHVTNALMRKMVADGEVDYLVPERVWAELAKALVTDSPHKFFTVLRGCNALSVLFPEIDREYGNTDQAHRNTQVIAALDELRASAGYSSDPRIRFSVLMRALGRDLSREQRLAQTEALCGRYRIPGDYTQLALTTIKLEETVTSRNPADIFKLMESAGAFRQGSVWPQLLRVYTIAGLVKQSCADKLVAVSQHAANIGAAQLEDKNLTGPDVGEAIRALRMNIVRNAFT